MCICPYLLIAFLLFLVFCRMRESFSGQITSEQNINVKRKGLPAPYGM